MSTYASLDLQPFLNNRGCTLVHERQFGALSLGGASLPTEEFPFGQPFLFEGTPFVFSETEAGDNMECAEQMISFPPRVVSCLHVIGTASNTDLFDTVSFLYQGGVVHQGRLYLSSFLSLQPAFIDRLALKLDYLHTRAGRYDYIQPCLWYCPLPLSQPSQIDSLQFEDNPSMHIFALTLETT